MKPVFKYALASLALAASSGAFAAVTTPDTGNGSLVLFVRDLSSPSRVFAADLGVTLDSLLTQDAITNTPGNTTDLRNGTPISVNAALPSFHSDALATFLQTSSALGYEYAILGGDTLGSSSVSDAFRYVGTNEVQFGTSFLSNTTTNQLNDNSGIASTVNGFFADLNGALVHHELRGVRPGRHLRCAGQHVLRYAVRRRHRHRRHRHEPVHADFERQQLGQGPHLPVCGCHVVLRRHADVGLCRRPAGSPAGGCVAARQRTRWSRHDPPSPQRRSRGGLSPRS
jgi:hypothetical protein